MNSNIAKPRPAEPLAAYVGNQGRHIREVSPFNVALPEGYIRPLVGGDSVQVTDDPITAGLRAWIPGDTGTREWTGQRARRSYPQVFPFPMLFNAFNHAIFNAPNGNMALSSAGRVTSAATARQIQFGFRFSF